MAVAAGLALPLQHNEAASSTHGRRGRRQKEPPQRGETNGAGVLGLCGSRADSVVGIGRVVVVAVSRAAIHRVVVIGAATQLILIRPESGYVVGEW